MLCCTREWWIFRETMQCTCQKHTHTPQLFVFETSSEQFEVPLVGSVHCGQGTSSTKVARNAAEVQGKRAGSSRASAEECSPLKMLVDGRRVVLISRWRSYPSARPSFRQLQPGHRREFRASSAVQRLRAHRKVSGLWVP